MNNCKLTSLRGGYQYLGAHSSKFNLSDSFWKLNKGTGTNQIAVWDDFPDMLGIPSGQSGNQCIAYNQIKGRFDFTVNGIYADSQLVKYSDITYGSGTLDPILSHELALYCNTVWGGVAAFSGAPRLTSLSGYALAKSTQDTGDARYAFKYTVTAFGNSYTINTPNGGTTTVTKGSTVYWYGYLNGWKSIASATIGNNGCSAYETGPF